MIVTITMVGYGDKYSLTIQGRVIGAILITGSIGLFGTFTGFAASWFLEVAQRRIKAIAEEFCLPAESPHREANFRSEDPESL